MATAEFAPVRHYYRKLPEEGGGEGGRGGDIKADQMQNEGKD